MLNEYFQRKRAIINLFYLHYFYDVPGSAFTWIPPQKCCCHMSRVRRKTKLVGRPKEKTHPVATVAHANLFLSCGAQLMANYKDAMLVLRHSIYENSILAENSTSQYSYKMYAFVNKDPAKKCKKYTSWIQRMGYTPLLFPNPVNISAIDFRTQINKTGLLACCKLYLYTLTDHPIVVHWDIDIIVLVRSHCIA